MYRNGVRCRIRVLCHRSLRRCVEYGRVFRYSVEYWVVVREGVLPVLFRVESREAPRANRGDLTLCRVSFTGTVLVFCVGHEM